MGIKKEKDDQQILSLLRQVAIDDGIKMGKLYAEKVWQIQQVVAKQHYQKLVQQGAKNLADLLRQLSSPLIQATKKKGVRSAGRTPTPRGTPVISAPFIGGPLPKSQSRTNVSSVPATPPGLRLLFVLSLAIVATGVYLNIPQVVDATRSLTCIVFRLCQEKPEFPGYGAEQ